MTLLAENGAAPDWVQVGNEINPGILLPAGSLQENPKQLASFLNAGYEAVKECVPAAQVITHLSCVNIREVCDPFLDTFFCIGRRDGYFGLFLLSLLVQYDPGDQGKEGDGAFL